jgi:hypothetical protein
MKKILLALLGIMALTVSKAQDKDEKKKPDYSKIDLSNRANDHFMIQYGYDGWSGTNDSINPSGFSRHFNFYFMYDKPFKTNPHYSLGIGLGYGSSNIFFDNTYINLKSLSPQLPFTNVSTTIPANAYKFDKYKLVTTFLEAPVEFRFAGNPVTPDKGMKAAIGIKAGFLLKAYTKGKNEVNASGQSLYGKNYIMKEVEKHYINTTRFAVTGRIGYGFISVDGSYQLTSFFKSGAGPTVNPWSIGLTLSGL